MELNHWKFTFFKFSSNTVWKKKTKVNHPESHYPELEAEELKDLLQNHSRIPSNKDN
jgi:hypothetical protein